MSEQSKTPLTDACVKDGLAGLLFTSNENDVLRAQCGRLATLARQLETDLADARSALRECADALWSVLSVCDPKEIADSYQPQQDAMDKARNLLAKQG